jgi:hypothetical protein
MDWSIVSPELLIGIGAGAVLLFAVLFILAFRGRRSNRRFDRLQPRKAVRQTAKAYKQSHPAFYEIIRVCEKNRLIDRLLEEEEVAHAFATLYRKRRNHGTKPITNSVLDLGSPHRQIEAAMITIVRSLYFQADLQGCLDPKADAELDRLLETLTK